MCGEKIKALTGIPVTVGSPPRVRGEAVNPVNGLNEVGITPACAGRRILFPDFRTTSGDHPRVCGEKYDRNLSTMPHRGSPPRVRGEALDIHPDVW